MFVHTGPLRSASVLNLSTALLIHDCPFALGIVRIVVMIVV